MKKYSTIFILCLALFFFSCSSSKSENDTDIIPDADAGTHDSESTDDDSDSQTSEIIDDSDKDDEDDSETDDSDSDTDEPLDVDYQGAEECPELSKAKFPYYNDDKSIHFCRKCDTPTVKDPQCMENLWKEAAAKLYAVSPESECKDGYPCEMQGIRNRTLEDWAISEENIGFQYPYRPHECDIILSAQSISTGDRWAADGTAGSFKHFNMSEGKAGIKLMNVNLKFDNYTTTSKVMIYDPAEKKYKAIAPMYADMLAYNKGCFLYLGGDFRVLQNADKYLFYVCEDGSRRVVYPKKIYWLSYTPALSEKWAIANIQEKEDGPKYTMYAKVGEWNWTKLMEGLSLYPQIVNDKVVFHDLEGMAYYCDLAQHPESIDKCAKMNREGEEIRFAVINENNESETVCESRFDSEISITKITVSEEGKKTYSVMENTFSDTDQYWKGVGYTPENYRDGYIFYTESYKTSESGDWNGNHCLYNITKKKRTCMNKVAGNPFKTNPNLGFGEWEGKWVVYQFLEGTIQAVRDLECYCEKESVCPFEEVD